MVMPQRIVGNCCDRFLQNIKNLPQRIERPGVSQTAIKRRPRIKVKSPAPKAVSCPARYCVALAHEPPFAVAAEHVAANYPANTAANYDRIKVLHLSNVV